MLLLKEVYFVQRTIYYLFHAIEFTVPIVKALRELSVENDLMRKQLIE